jgi:tetratricopeptide (TPR) repeat protein
VESSESLSAKAHVTRQADKPTGRRDLLIITGVLLVVTAGYFAFKRPVSVPSGPKAEIQSHSDMPTGDMADAIKTLDNLPTDYSSLVTLGNEFMDERNYPVAAECYKRALALQGNSPNVRVDYGACLHGMGLTHRAIEEFRRVLDINPSHAIVNFNLGIVYYDLNETDSARVYWRKYLTIDPNGQAAQAARDLLRETGG